MAQVTLGFWWQESGDYFTTFARKRLGLSAAHSSLFSFRKMIAHQADFYLVDRIYLQCQQLPVVIYGNDKNRQEERQGEERNQQVTVEN